MSLRLDGKNPLSYLGVSANQPPQLVVLKRQPTTQDSNFNLGTLWVIPTQGSGPSEEIWQLVGLNGNVAQWKQVFPQTSSEGIAWSLVSGPSVAMAVESGYAIDGAVSVTLTLPALADFADRIMVVGSVGGSWSIAQNAGQKIYFGTQVTTTGVGGSLSSSANNDCVELICVKTNTDWVVRSSVGNLTYV